jgi:AcrR family transcriptional regulator
MDSIIDRGATGKGSETRDHILRAAVQLSRDIGLSGLTIGGLAEMVGMSKSGLFAHFGSKEDLQIAVLQTAQSLFGELVLRPAIAEAKGLGRLRAIVRRWLDWSGGGAELKGGCVVLAAFHEFDDRPGPVRDEVLLIAETLRQTLRRAIGQAVGSGELPGDLDVEQFSFELFGLVMASHLHVRLLGDLTATRRALAGFDRLIAAPPRLTTP